VRRRGFALAELLIALVIAGIIGIALSRLVISQARFVSHQDGIMRARAGARAAYNVMMNEVRMVTDSGLTAAWTDSFDIRVPFAFGIACQQSGGSTVVSVIPTDTAQFFAASLGGYAWRDTVGTYHFVEPATFSSLNASQTACTGAAPSVRVTSGPSWSARAVSVSPNVVATPVGSIVYFYQRIRYAFAPSVDIPGRLALWRTVLSTGTREELVAPFDTGSAFQWVYGTNFALSATPPVNLATVRGIRPNLVGASEHTPQGKSAPTTFDFTSNLLFRNVQ